MLLFFQWRVPPTASLSCVVIAPAACAIRIITIRDYICVSHRGRKSNVWSGNNYFKRLLYNNNNYNNTLKQYAINNNVLLILLCDPSSVSGPSLNWILKSSLCAICSACCDRRCFLLSLQDQFRVSRFIKKFIKKKKKELTRSKSEKTWPGRDQLVYNYNY